MESDLKRRKLTNPAHLRAGTSQTLPWAELRPTGPRIVEPQFSFGLILTMLPTAQKSSYRTEGRCINSFSKLSSLCGLPWWIKVLKQNRVVSTKSSRSILTWTMPVPAVEEGGGLGVQRFRVVPPAEEGVKSPDGNLSRLFCLYF